MDGLRGALHGFPHRLESDLVEAAACGAFDYEV
jgi:hypothetical protein